MPASLKVCDRYSFPVAFAIRDESGTLVDATFKAIFKRFTQDEVERLTKPDPDKDGLERDREIIDLALVGWDQVTDENDAPMPYSVANRDRAFQALVGMRPATVRAWYKSLSVENESGN